MRMGAKQYNGFFLLTDRKTFFSYLHYNDNFWSCLSTTVIPR